TTMATAISYKANSGRSNDVEDPPRYSENDNTADRDNLPSYEATALSQDPPPSYESLYGRIKAARSESTGFLNFMKTFIIIILSTIGFTIILGVFIAIPLAMLIMGSIHLDHCPAERMIPIYLIVSGCAGIVRNVYSLIQRCRKTEQEREEDQAKVNPAESVANCFLIAWFITGCVYIYRTRNSFQHDTKGDSDYCDYNLYWFAFWITTAVYIIMAASCFCVCCLGCLASFVGKNNE
ncbi:unnamed protein product, partial [Candidula unifasciata]